MGVKMKENGKFPITRNSFSSLKNHLKCAKLTMFLHLLETNYISNKCVRIIFIIFRQNQYHADNIPTLKVPWTDMGVHCGICEQAAGVFEYFASSFGGGPPALLATIFLQNGSGCQKLGGKNVIWLEKIEWVCFLPWGFFTTPDPPAKGIDFLLRPFKWRITCRILIGILYAISNGLRCSKKQPNKQDEPPHPHPLPFAFPHD